MRKLIITAIAMLSIVALCFTINRCHAQEIIYGTNGSNVSANLTPEVCHYVNDMIPAGGEYVLRLRNDKSDVATAMSDVEVANVIRLRDTLAANGKSFFVIYTFDVRGEVTLSQNFYGYNQLRTAGIIFIGDEMGNEEFNKKLVHAGLWANYTTNFTPILNELTRIGATEPKLFSMSTGIGENNNFKAWDDAGAAFINSNPNYQPVFHLYYGHGEVAVIDSLQHDKLEQSIVHDYVSSKDIFYKNLADETMESTLLKRTIDYFKTKFPDGTKRIYMTEYGPNVSTGNLQNTLGFHIVDSWFLNQTQKYKDQIAVVCKHNGATISMTGIISKRNKQDITGGEYVKRLGYLTMKMFLKYKDNKNYSYYNNPTRDQIDISAADVIALSGSNFYSSSGYCEWWADGSDKTYEVSDFTSFTGNDLPAISFGYYRTEEKDTVIYNCRDTIVIAGFDTTYQITTTHYIVYDTTEIKPTKTCLSCSSFLYRFFHQRTCRDCDNAPTYSVITREYDISDTVIYNIPILDTIQICDIPIPPVDTIVIDTIVMPPDEFQPLNAPVLYFHNEVEFRDFLVHYGLATNYNITPPKYTCDCHIHRLESYYQNDSIHSQPDASFLHEDWTKGMCNSDIKNHPVSGKMQNRIFESTGVSGLDICNIDETWENPNTHQIVKFYNSFEWWDRRGEQLFNTNLKLWQLWGLEGNYIYLLTLIDRDTGTDLDYEHDSSPINTNHLRENFSFLKPNK